MSLHYGEADRQPDSHSVSFRCIETFEELVYYVRFKTDARIFYAETHLVPLIPFGSDEQLSRAIVNCAHCLRSISQEVEDDLLKLDAVSCHGRQVVRKLLAQNHAVTL